MAVVANAGCCDESSSPKKKTKKACLDDCLEQSPNARSPSKERDELVDRSEPPDNSSNARDDSVEHYKPDILKKGESPDRISENLDAIPRRRSFLRGAKDVGDAKMSKSVDNEMLEDTPKDTLDKVATNVAVKVATNVAVSSRQGEGQGQKEADGQWDFPMFVFGGASLLVAVVIMGCRRCRLYDFSWVDGATCLLAGGGLHHVFFGCSRNVC